MFCFIKYSINYLNTILSKKFLKRRIGLLLLTSIVMLQISCKEGGDQPPVLRTVFFYTPANASWIAPSNTRNVNFEMVMKVATTKNGNPIIYPGGPIFKSFTTSNSNPNHQDPISESIDQPEGATAYVIDLDIAFTECGYPVHGASVNDPEKGAKGRYSYISEQISYPHSHTVAPNRLVNYHTIQCP